MVRTSRNIGLAVLASTAGPGFLTSMIGSPSSLASRTDIAEIRRSEMVGASLALAVGVAVSMMAGDPFPLVGTVLVLGVMLYEYERVLRDKS